MLVTLDVRGKQEKGNKDEAAGANDWKTRRDTLRREYHSRIEANYENLTPLEKNIADFSFTNLLATTYRQNPLPSSCMYLKHRCLALRRNAATPVTVSFDLLQERRCDRAAVAQQWPHE